MDYKIKYNDFFEFLELKIIVKLNYIVTLKIFIN